MRRKNGEGYSFFKVKLEGLKGNRIDIVKLEGLKGKRIEIVKFEHCESYLHVNRNLFILNDFISLTFEKNAMLIFNQSKIIYTQPLL